MSSLDWFLVGLIVGMVTVGALVTLIFLWLLPDVVDKVAEKKIAERK